MKNGSARFDFYLEKLEGLIKQSMNEINPALWLYNNDARTVIFMLEGLAKLYAGLHNKKRFEKIKDDLKLLEDGLGAIDYYDAFAREFATYNNFPTEIISYLQAQTREKIQHLNDILQQRNWIGENADRIKKIRKKLNDADWMKDKEEVESIEKFYKNSVEDIIEFFVSVNNKITEIESQVHELRRKLRWLSIYPRALQGVIQLTDHNAKEDHLVKYLTEETIHSPFNKMPDAGNNQYFLMLEKNYFLSLSWVISSLGKLKDNGLRIVAISEAIQQIKKTGKPESLALAYHLLGEQHPKLTTILSESSGICETYFMEKNLDKLVVGVSGISGK